MTIKWGDPIECNGVRPDWLRDDEPAEVENSPREWLEWSGCVWHKFIQAIRLPADHPAYVALARGFHPWSGGESAPDDWDGDTVLLRGGIKECPGPLVTNWSDDLGISTIIGYRKRNTDHLIPANWYPGKEEPRDYVRITPLTVAQWDEIANRGGLFDWAQSVGLIRPETTAERFTRETGHAVTEAVEAALNWKGE